MIVRVCVALDSDATIMRKRLWVLAVECLFILMSHQSLLQKRRCVYKVTHTNNHKLSTVGNVSGSVQLCENTHCCFAIFKIIDGQPEAYTLACDTAEKSCPDAACNARPVMENRFVRCVCSTDLCNSNISLWTPEPEQPPHTHTHSAGMVAGVGILSVIVIVFGIIAINWRSFNKEKSKTTNQNEEENLQSSYDYSSERSCSCQTKISQNNITDIEVQEVVARGNFATVFRGKCSQSAVAVKVYPAVWKDVFLREKEIYELPLMKHSGIVHFLGTGRKPDDGSWFMALQYAEHGSLHSFLCQHTTSWMFSLKLCQSLSQGLSYLHSELFSHDVHKPPVAHRDLCSSNVLVKADGSCVLCDFGSSTILRTCLGSRSWQSHLANMQSQGPFYTLRYMSPEILEGSVNLRDDSFPLQGDVYALGLILWEIWMRCSDLFEGGAVPQHLLPYELELEANVTMERLVLFVSEMDRRPSIPDYWETRPQGSTLIELLMACWDRDTDARLTAPCAANRLTSLQSSCSQ